MRAIVVDPSTPGRLAIRDVERTEPRSNEALVRIHSISVNPGEVRRALAEAPAGSRPGWDFAGIVEQPAADGSGPARGTRVVGFRDEGAWAELTAASGSALAAIPDEVTTVQAATLPVAGLTALWALSFGGFLAGRKVLINGASGGVGHFALQIARASGAHVVGAVRREAQAAQAKEDGADEVIVSQDLSEARGTGPFSLVLESAGGAAFANAVRALEPDGLCVVYGSSSRTPASFDPMMLYHPDGGVRVRGFYLRAELLRSSPAEGLSRLLRLVAGGRVRPRIEVEAGWEDIASIAARLINRQITGKAVLHLP